MKLITFCGINNEFSIFHLLNSQFTYSYRSPKFHSILTLYSVLPSELINKYNLNAIMEKIVEFLVCNMNCCCYYFGKTNRCLMLAKKSKNQVELVAKTGI